MKVVKVTLIIKPKDGVDADLIREIVELSGSSVPFNRQAVYHGDQPIAEIIDGTVEVVDQD